MGDFGNRLKDRLQNDTGSKIILLIPVALLHQKCFPRSQSRSLLTLSSLISPISDIDIVSGSCRATDCSTRAVMVLVMNAIIWKKRWEFVEKLLGANWSILRDFLCAVRICQRGGNDCGDGMMFNTFSSSLSSERSSSRNLAQFLHHLKCPHQA